MTGTLVIIIVLAAGVGFLTFFLVRNILLPRRAAAAAGFLNKNKNLQAIKAGKAAVEKDPRDAEAHYHLGRALLAENRSEQALREFKSVSRLGLEGKNIPETEFRQAIAKLYVQYNERDEALKEYVLLIKKHPENAEYYFQAGVLFGGKNRGDLAEQYLKKAASLNPKDPRFYYELGVQLYQGKKTKEAAAALETAVKLDPNNAKTYFYLGRIRKEAKDYTGALPSLEKASRDQEYKLRSLVEIGGCYMSLNMMDKALAELERAVAAIQSEDDSDSLYARYFLGLCYEKKQEFPKALAQWDKIYARKKNFRDVGEKLTQYQQYRQEP